MTIANISPMPMRCECGYSKMISPRTMLRMGTQPAQAIGMWALSCPACLPKAAIYEWGWILAGGRRVGCLYGEGEAEENGVVALSTHFEKRAVNARK